MVKRLMGISILGLMVLLQGTALANQAVPVFVSIVPQKYFVQQIGGDLVQVRVMVQPGASPATYEPKPSQMAALSRSALYFSIGVPFERTWLKKIASANPKMRIVHTDRGVQKIPMADHHHHDDTGESHDPGHKAHKADPEHHDTRHGAHGPKEHDEHGTEGHGEHHGAEQNEDQGLDPHIWMSPRLVKAQAGVILEALVHVDPENRAVYEKNYHAFSGEIDALDRELHDLFEDRKGLQFMVFHPAWGYFAHAYGLEQVAIEIQGKDPKPAQLKALIGHAREKGIRVIFVQPQFSTKSATLVAAEIGGKVVPANPLALDWMANMKTMAAQFKEALR